MPILKRLYLALLLISAPLAHAAEQGDIGRASSSRFTITLALQPSLEITTATDISINIDNRDVDATYRQPFCVRGTIDSRYSVTATGETGSGGAFVLRSGNEVLPYSVAYVGDPDSSEPDELVDGVPSPTYSILPFSSDCSGSTYFVVTFQSTDLQQAGSGLYNGSLTFLVSPV